MTETQKRQVAVMLGGIAGVHALAKDLDDAGVAEMDMVCCGLEDVFGMLEPLLGMIGAVEGLVMNS